MKHLLATLVTLILAAPALRAQLADPIPDPVGFEGLRLETETYVVVAPSAEAAPLARLGLVRTLPDGRQFVNDLRGLIHSFAEGSSSAYLDIRPHLPHFVDAPGFGTGLYSFAFHPEFLQNGKLYTAHAEGRVFADGSLIVSPEARSSGGPGQVVRMPAAHHRYSPEGEPGATLASTPAGVEGQLPGAGAERFTADAPFERVSQLAVDGNELLLGISDKFEIERRSQDGRILRILRLPDVDLTITDADREQLRQHYMQSDDGRSAPEEMERALSLLSLPETKPPFAQLIVDAERNLWVRHFRGPGAIGPEVWSVFEPGGQLVGYVQTPERLRVGDIGTDYILGVWTDSLDVQYVRLYWLHRRAGGPRPH